MCPAWHSIVAPSEAQVSSTQGAAWYAQFTLECALPYSNAADIESGSEFVNPQYTLPRTNSLIILQAMIHSMSLTMNRTAGAHSNCYSPVTAIKLAPGFAPSRRAQESHGPRHRLKQNHPATNVADKLVEISFVPYSCHIVLQRPSFFSVCSFQRSINAPYSPIHTRETNLHLPPHQSPEEIKAITITLQTNHLARRPILPP